MGSAAVSAAEPEPLASAFERHAAPRPLPEVALGLADGGTVPLSAFRGRVVLMNFWATWCAPCVREMPSLARLHKRLRGEDFTVIAVSEDRGGPQAVEPFVRRHGLEGVPIFYDARMTASRALGIDGIPTTLLIDRDGREVGRIQAAAEWDSPEAIALVRREIEAGALEQARAPGANGG